MGTVSERIVLDHAQAIGATRELAGEMRELSAAQAEATRNAAMLERGTRRLQDLAASSDTERAALGYQRQAAEIRALAALTGDQATAARAMAQLDAQAAARLTVTTRATQAQTAATMAASTAADRAAVSHGAMAAGMTNLGNQAADVAVQLASGASPAMVLMQQGPQIAMAAASMGGVGAALSAVGSAAMAAAPYVAAAVVALGAVAAVGVTVANATRTAATEAREHNEALIEQATNAGRTSEEVDKLAASWRSYLSLTSETARDLAVINGQLDESADAAGRAAGKVDAAARATLVAQGQDVARLQVALTAAEAEIEATRGRERAAAIGVASQLRDQLESARERLDTTKAQVDADRESAGAVAEYGVELRKSNEVLREREEMAREAARRAAEEARKEEERRRRLSAEMMAAAGFAAAGMFAPDANAQAGLEYLRMVQAEMDGAIGDDRANALALLTEGISRWPEYAEAFRTIIEDTQPPAVMQGVATATSVVGTVGGGPQAVMGTIAAATGPIGALVVGIIQAVVNLEDTIAQFREFVTAIWDVVGRLPDILLDAIQSGILNGMVEVVDAVVGLVQGLAENLDDILMGIVRSIPQVTTAVLEAVIVYLPQAVIDLVGAILSPKMWGAIIEELWRGIGQVVGDVWRTIVEEFGSIFTDFLEGLKDLLTPFDEGLFPKGGPSSAGDFFGDMFLGPNRQGVLSDIWRGPRGEGGLRGLGESVIGAFDTGAQRVPRPGLYMLHGGERVLTSGQAGSARNREAPGLTIQIGSVMGGRAGVRELVDLIRRESGALGSRVALV